MPRILRFVACSLLLLASACSEPVLSQHMEVAAGALTAPVNPLYKGKMAVRQVVGGEETSPLWASNVSNSEFQKALQDSLANMGYAAPEATTAKYQIEVALSSIDQPMFGLTFDVTSRVQYTVKNNGSEKIYPIVATGSASPSDAIIASKRLDIANERSIQENIKAFLTKLSGDGK